MENIQMSAACATAHNLPCPADTITVLTSRGPLLTKKWMKDGTIQGHSKAKHHTLESFKVENIHDLAEVLGRLAKMPTSGVVRGDFIGHEAAALVPDPDGERKGKLVLRQAAYFTDPAHHWIMFDLDNYVPVKANPDTDPVAAIEEWIATYLPQEFIGVTYYWQLSSSAGHPSKKGSLRAHLWFFIDRAMNSPEAHAWVTMLKLPIDRAPLNVVQLHYTADPVMAGGVVDPIAVRGGLEEGFIEDVVQLQLDEGALAVALLESRKGIDAATGAGGECADPRLKTGLVGAFCRAFRVEDVLQAEWFEGNFEQVNNRRFTWLDGNGAAEGAYLTEDGMRFVNTHNSSPGDSIGKGLNAYDLARVYNFGGQDDLVPEDDRWNWDDLGSRPSEAAMRKWARSLPEVQAELDNGPDADDNPSRSSVKQPVHSRGDIAAMIEATDDFDELTVHIARLVANSGLREAEREFLNKQIAKKSKVSPAALKKDAINFQQVTGTQDSDHLRAARRVIKAHGDGNLLHADGYLWAWRGDGVWRRTDDRETKQKIHTVAAVSDLTANVVGSILDMVKTEAHRARHRFDQNPTSINCSNGELVYQKDRWELLPHNREHYRTAMVPVAYDPAAQAPRFCKFLEEVFEGDPDIDDKINVVLEALGYTLIPTCHLEKFFMLIGAGANGKSVLLGVVAALVGREHVCAVQPSQFENRFQRGHLQGRLANIITEIAEGGEIADAQLKSLVSGEMTTAEHKHKDPFDFIPYAKHWFGTNHLPHTRDFSDALFRRALILTFNNKFDGEKRDVHLADALKAELPGIFNLALAGLQRLIMNRAFTECSSSVDIARQWRKEADQTAQFVEESCLTGPDCRSTSNDLFTQYKSWALSAGVLRTLNRNNFTSRLKRLGYEPGRGAGGTRMIEGVKPKYGGVKPNDDEFVPCEENFAVSYG